MFAMQFNFINDLTKNNDIFHVTIISIFEIFHLYCFWQYSNSNKKYLLTILTIHYTNSILIVYYIVYL